ncbi:MAG: hypothetical protein ABR924_20375, partial [Terracidiphilus sp.]
WRRMLNRHRVGLIFLFFMPALWQVQRVKPTLFSISRGMAVIIANAKPQFPKCRQESHHAFFD